MSALRPGSRIRRAAIARLVANSLAAINRRDYEGAFVAFHPEVTTTFARELGALGLPTRTTTKADRMAAQVQWGLEWTEFRQDEVRLVDFGERVLILSTASATGLHSGASPTMELAYLVELDAGLIVRERLFLSHAQALEAAGIEAAH
jgi:hypothetical protein